MFCGQQGTRHFLDPGGLRRHVCVTRPPWLKAIRIKYMTGCSIFPVFWVCDSSIWIMHLNGRKIQCKPELGLYTRILVHHREQYWRNGWCSCLPRKLHWWHYALASGPHVYTIIALWWWFCPCRVGGAVWNHTAWLFPLMPLPTLSLFYSYFLFGNEYRKTSLEKILGNFSFVSIYYHWNWFEDLHHVQGIEIKDESETLHSQYLRENNGTTCHHGHPADCQLALTNVVEVQTKVVTND